MPTPIIHNIALKNMGVFRDSKTPQTLQKYNLIYGFNGSGKTTLSRVFNSLSTGVVHTDLPDNGTFRVELNNDSVLTNISNQDYLIGRLLVFNVDFIEANFRWKEGKANPVFYLGSDQMERADDLKRMLNQKNELNTKYDTAYRDYSYKKNVFYTFKRSTARNIGEKLLLRNYTAPNLVQDYSFYDYDMTSPQF